MLVRSQATNQRPPDRTARTGDQDSHHASFQLALRRLEARPTQCSAASTQPIEAPVPCQKLLTIRSIAGPPRDHLSHGLTLLLSSSVPSGCSGGTQKSRLI